jgi:Ca-activated chloride channel family protein
MLPALEMALSNNQEFSRFRQVVFLTDGNISNETELFNIIKQHLGSNRLFTIGIGSAPNSYFMRKAANLGRGTFTYIGDINEVKNKTVALFKKLETPALINIQLDIDRDKYEIFPNIIPDLYAGETATILIKGNQLPQYISIQGDYGNIEWSHNSALSEVSQKGIRIAWAREKIASLMNLHNETSSVNERDVIQEEVTETAIIHHLVSRYTSLVAVDVTPVNLDGLLLRQRLKNNLPHGWKRAKDSNGIMLAQTATDARLKFLLSLILFITAIFIYRYSYQDSKWRS